MKILTGRPVSPGYSEGTAVVHYSSASVEFPRYEIGQDDVDGELDRFHDAVSRSREQLQQLERRVLSDLGRTYSSIFSAHLALLRDRQFVEQIQQRVRDDLVRIILNPKRKRGNSCTASLTLRVTIGAVFSARSPQRVSITLVASKAADFMNNAGKSTSNRRLTRRSRI